MTPKQNIYVNFPIPSTLEEFLKLFNGYVTEGMCKGARTYKNKECTVVQSYHGAKRSFQETMDCAQKYFPEATEEEIFKTLINLNLKDKSGRQLYMRPTFCGTIQKPVYMFYYRKDINWFDEQRGKNGETSWKNLFKKHMNISTIQELYIHLDRLFATTATTDIKK